VYLAKFGNIINMKVENLKHPFSLFIFKAIVAIFILKIRVLAIFKIKEQGI
jgi:hypothetical protein